MRTRFGLIQIILRAARDDGFLVRDKIAQHRLDAHKLGLALGNGEKIDAEGNLQVAVFIKVSERLLHVRVLFQLDDRAKPRPVRLIPDIIDAAKSRLFFFAELEDFFQHLGFGNHVRHLRHDQQGAARAALFNLNARAKRQLAFSCFIGGFKLRRIDQHAACGKIRRGHDAHQVSRGRILVVNQHARGGHSLFQVVRRDVRRQPHRDAGRAVDQKIRIARRQKIRLF